MSKQYLFFRKSKKKSVEKLDTVAPEYLEWGKLETSQNSNKALETFLIITMLKRSASFEKLHISKNQVNKKQKSNNNNNKQQNMNQPQKADSN